MEIMNLELSISDVTARWLEEKAHAAGTDEATLAANLLEQTAARDASGNGATKGADDWMKEFRHFVASVPRRPGPPVDAGRDGIYD